jgi:predicted AlkP superfamily pyrophosphatase or phosphodiesterase
MWAKEFGMVINNIGHSAASSRGDTGGLSRSGFDPHDFIPLPRLGSHLFQNGVRSTAFMHSSIINSGLSLMQMDDVNVEPYVDEADLWVSLTAYLEGRKGVREYVYVYYSHVDSLMHRFSAQDMRVSLQFDAFSSIFDRAFLQKLPKDIAKDTLFILIADHGSMTTPRNEKYVLRHHPALLNNLVMQPTCENRLAFFYIKPGKIDAVRDYIHKTWPGEFYVLDSGLALESGLFGEGPFHPNARERLGDLIAVSRGDAYFWWAPKPNHMAGRHGGLSPSEMLVPFYALPLGEIS